MSNVPTTLTINTASEAEATCESSSDCQTDHCLQPTLVNHGCYQGKCYHGVADPQCFQKGNLVRYPGMQADTWCYDSRKDSRCKSSFQAQAAPQNEVASREQAFCKGRNHCRTSSCSKAGFANHGCIGGFCYHGIQDPKCVGKANGHVYDGMQPGTWCWDGRSDSQCSARGSPTMRKLRALRWRRRKRASCRTHSDCNTRHCNSHRALNLGCVSGMCLHGTADPKCFDLPDREKYPEMQGSTWCQGGRKTSLCRAKPR